MEYSDDLLSFSTKLVFSTEGLPNDLKVYWGNILDFFYSSKNATQRIRQKEMQVAVIRFRSQEEWMKDFLSLKQEDRILTIVFFRLLLRRAEAIDQPIAADSLLLKIELLTGMMESTETQLLKIRFEECAANFSRHENRRRIIVPASIWPLALDYVIKWLVLIGCRLASSSSGTINGITFAESTLFIGIFIYISYRDSKHNQNLFKKYKAVDDFKIDFQFSAAKYTWLAFFFITSITIMSFIDVEDHGGSISDYLSSALLFSFYYFVALRFFPSGKVSEASLMQQLRSQTIQNEELDSDSNDEAIVHIETEINSRTGRLDAYVLESALFGALAFSGFLQIIATDYISFKELDQFSNLIFNAMQNLVSMDIKAMQNMVAKLYTKNNLFCMAAIETLLCSGFFIAVIASRLRFSNVADRVKRALEIAKTYNAKEELLKGKENLSNDHQELFTRFNSKVNEQILQSKRALEEISPISGYMEYFRNAGLLMFLLVLISCGLFVTSFLGWLYVAIGAVTWTYFNREFLIAKSREATLILQLNFIRRPYFLLILSVGLTVSGFLMRIFFTVESTTFLIALGFFFLGLYTFFQVILLPHYDVYFGEIEKSSNNYIRNWSVIQTVYGFLLLLVISSLCLSGFVRYGQASFISIVLSSFLGLMTIIVTYYCCKEKGVGIALGCISALLPISIAILTFPEPDLPVDEYGPLLLFLGMAGVPFIATRTSKKQFHVFLRNLSTISFSLLFILFIPFMYGTLTSKTVFSIPVTLTTLYQHNTYKFDSLTYWMNYKFPGKPLSAERLDCQLNKSKTYRKHYGTANGFTFIYWTDGREMSSMADLLLERGKEKKDSVSLQKALELVREQRNILRLFKFSPLREGSGLLEANILMELNKKPEAIKSLKELLASEADDNVKQSVKKRLREIEEGKIK